MNIQSASKILFLFLCLTIILFSATVLHAGCSADIGRVTINEINTHSQSVNGPYFVELKALDSSIINSSPTLWADWTLDLCSRPGALASPSSACKYNVPIGAGTLLNNWLVVDQDIIQWDYLDLNNGNKHGMEIILRDGNDNIVDYFSVDGYSINGSGGCSFPYGTTYAGGNNFNLQRQPDGVGDWSSSGGGNSGDETENLSNDPVPPGSPLLSVAETTAKAGSSMTFSLQLSATSSTPVIISYSTRNGSAIAGSDYTAATGSVTIPAGTTSVTVSINTSPSATVDSFFYLVLDAVTTGNAIILNNLTKGTILPASSIDHYEIRHDGNGLTCQPEAITLKACADTLSPCTPLTTASSVDLMTDGGNWLESNPVTFTGSTTVNLRHTSAGTASISLSGANPSAAVQCYENGGLETPCSLVFHNSGFIFDIVDAISGSNQTVNLHAVRLDDSSQACVPLFASRSLPLNFNFSYTTPAGNPAGSQAAINGNSFAGMLHTETLAFDAVGATSFTLSYPDAGGLTFTASYDDGQAYALGSDDAIFYPAEFRVTAGDQAWLAADESSTILARAGANFAVTIEALNALGTVTPNYTGTAMLGATNVGPAAGATGILGTGNITLAGGTATLTDQTYSEVGIMTLTANDPNYLGFAIGGTSANIGRFIPNSFRILAGLTIAGILNHADGTFSYFGHEITGYSTNPSFTLEALSVGGTRTKNYRGAYAKLTSPGISVMSPSVDKVATAQPLSITRAAANIITDNGTVTYTFGADGVIYTKPTATTAPLTNPQFDFLITQLNDGEVSTLAPADGTIPVNGGTILRYGRLAIEDSFGPETEAISLPVKTEYWDGSLWQQNGIDSVSIYSYTKIENAITTTEDESGTPLTPAISNLSILIGAGAFSLTPATDPVDPGGTVDITLATPNWLKFDWDNDLGTPDTGPTATATFGIYRGRDRIISWEELPTH